MTDACTGVMFGNANDNREVRDMNAEDKRMASNLGKTIAVLVGVTLALIVIANAIV